MQTWQLSHLLSFSHMPIFDVMCTLPIKMSNVLINMTTFIRRDCNSPNCRLSINRPFKINRLSYNQEFFHCPSVNVNEAGPGPNRELGSPMSQASPSYTLAVIDKSSPSGRMEGGCRWATVWLNSAIMSSLQPFFTRCMHLFYIGVCLDYIKHSASSHRHLSSFPLTFRSCSVTEHSHRFGFVLSWAGTWASCSLWTAFNNQFPLK